MASTVQKLLDSTTLQLQSVQALWHELHSTDIQADSHDDRDWREVAAGVTGVAQALSRLSARMQSNQASSLVTAGNSQVVCRTVTSPQAIPAKASSAGVRKHSGDHELMSMPKKRKSSSATHALADCGLTQASFLTETPFQAACAELAHNNSNFADVPDHQSSPGFFAPQSASFDGCEPSTAETASTPLAVAALAAMGLDLGNAAEHQSRMERQNSKTNQQMSRQASGVNAQQENRSSEPAGSCQDANGPKKCTCKKSRCLKLYCECFAAGVFCNDCSCVDCCNTVAAVGQVQMARQNIIKSRPGAFDPKVSAAEGQHSKGCNCRKSRCQKKYCECFQAGVPCTEACRCTNCQNCGPTSGSGPPQPDAVTVAHSSSSQMSGDVKQASSNSQQQGTAQPMHSQPSLGQQLSRQCSLPVTSGTWLEHQASYQDSVPATTRGQPEHVHPTALPVAHASILSQQLSHQHSLPLSHAASLMQLDAAGLLAGPLEPVEVTDDMQLLTGYTVSSHHPVNPISVRPEALRSLGSMPPGTILLPANHSLPPGSVLLSTMCKSSSQQALLAEARLQLRDTDQCTVKPAVLASAQEGQVRSAIGEGLVTHRQLSTCSLSNQPGAEPNMPDQAITKQSSRGWSKSALDKSDAGARTEGLGSEAGLASLSASEGPSVQDDATSPPPAGPFAFSRETLRQPFAAIQLQAVPTEALVVATAGANTRQRPVSPPKQFSKQARSRRQKGSSAVPPRHASSAGQQTSGIRQHKATGLTRTAASKLSMAPSSRADSAKRPFWESPPTRVAKRQSDAAPLAVVNLRSGRISKLTERFSLYRANSTGPKQVAMIEDECENMSPGEQDLSDVVAALCGLGQPTEQ